jgi:hypothetical protein
MKLRTTVTAVAVAVFGWLAIGRSTSAEADQQCRSRKIERLQEKVGKQQHKIQHLEIQLKLATES